MRKTHSGALLWSGTFQIEPDIVGFVALANMPDKVLIIILLAIHRHDWSENLSQNAQNRAVCLLFVDVTFVVRGTGRLENGTCERYRLIGGLGRVHATWSRYLVTLNGSGSMHDKPLGAASVNSFPRI